MNLFDLLGISRTHIPEGEIAVRLLVAIAFGAAIGFEREMRERSAGLRTHMLTALAAAMFTIFSLEIFFAMRGLAEPANGDPIRLIQAVTAGVSFLAAGTIIHGSGTVSGLTTGAGMWLAGAIGAASGAGFYLIALFGAIFAVGIIVLLEKFEKHCLNTKSDDQ